MHGGGWSESNKARPRSRKRRHQLAMVTRSGCHTVRHVDDGGSDHMTVW
jgi:hypothetical protein